MGWYLVIVILFRVSSSLIHLKGFGTVGGHILGFAALNVYGKLALTTSFCGNPMMTLLTVFIALFTMTLLFGSSKLIGGCMGSHMSDEDHDRWHDQSLDTGNDFYALCLGFLITMWMRFQMSGKIPSIDGELGGATSSDVWLLSCLGVALVCLSSAFGAVQSHIEDQESNIAHSVAFATSIVADAAAFSLLFAAMWYFGDMIPVETMAHLIVALFFSSVAIVWIDIVHFVFGRCGCGNLTGLLKGTFTAVGLAVGFSWEKTFDSAVDGVSHGAWLGQSDSDKLLFSVFLLLVVFPAWMVYVLPKADEDLRKEFAGKKLELATIFCGIQDVADEEEQGSESDGS